MKRIVNYIFIMLNQEIFKNLVFKEYVRHDISRHDVKWKEGNHGYFDFTHTHTHYTGKNTV